MTSAAGGVRSSVFQRLGEGIVVNPRGWPKNKAFTWAVLLGTVLAFAGGSALGSTLVPSPSASGSGGHFTAESDPTLTLTPQSGIVGSTTQASGTGFPDSKTISFTLDGVVAPSSCMSNSSGGGFYCPVTIPAVPNGPQTMNASYSTFNATAAFTVDALISILPTSGFVGSTALVTGSGFPADASITFKTLHHVNVSAPSCTSYPNGSFSCPITIPVINHGTHTIIASNTTAAVSAAGTFSVDAFLSVNPSNGIVGSAPTASGTGYPSNATIAFTLDGAPASSTCSSVANGTFGCTVSAPAVPNGAQPLVATNGSVNATTPFTVEASLTLSPTSGAVGSITTATGKGFAASASISFTLDGVAAPSPTCSSDTMGSFSCPVTIPAVPHGAQTMVASDGTNTASATFTIGGSLSLNPVSGTVGSSTSVTGAGFLASRTITFLLDGVAAPSASCTSGPSGSFSCTATVPAVANGPQTMVASDGTNTGSATFTVDASLSLNPSSGFVGSTVTATGAGFLGSQTISFQLNGVPAPASSCTSVSNGNFSCPVSIPGVPHGTHAMSASDGTNTASAAFSVDASVSLNPTSGLAGTTTTATGTGFAADGPISFTLDGVNAPSASCSSDSTGTFACPVTIPAVPHGAQTMLASDGTNIVSSMFTLGASFSLSPSSGIVGSTTTATGDGYLAGATITFSLDGTAAASICTTDSSGSFSCAVTVPAVPSGTQTMVASDGTNTASADFTVSASIVVTPSQGPFATSFNVVGTGFGAGPGVSVTFNAVEITPVTCPTGSFNGTAITTDVSGSFSCTFVLASEPGGNGTVMATQGPNQATAIFFVTPSFTTSSDLGTVGDPIAVTGNGFGASTPYSLQWNSTSTLCTGSTDSGGAFSCTFNVPSAPEGLHALTAVEATAKVVVDFTVFPSVSVSRLNGTVGSSVTVTGAGFQASKLFKVSWNATTTVCSNLTNSNGAVSCTFAVPRSAAGLFTLRATEGNLNTTFSFTVIASPPAASTPFPWWLVGVVALVVVAVAATLFYFYRRPHPFGRPASRRPRPGGPIQPYGGIAPPSSELAAPVSAAAVPAPSAVGAPSGSPTEPEPDIDEMIARLERMSIQMFKKTPKELGDQSTAGESSEPASGS